MSRYVRIAAPVRSLEAVASALTELGIAFERPAQGVMLQGSLECTGEPVALRVAAGLADAIEDFGFAVHDGQLALVCGDVDREVLRRELLPRIAEHHVRVAVGHMPGVEVVGVTTGSGRGSGCGGTSSDE